MVFLGGWEQFSFLFSKLILCRGVLRFMSGSSVYQLRPRSIYWQEWLKIGQVHLGDILPGHIWPSHPQVNPQNFLMGYGRSAPLVAGQLG